MDFKIADDIELAQELLECSRRELARKFGMQIMTFNRWAQGGSEPSERSLSGFYDQAFKRGIRFNNIKAQLYQEDYSNSGDVVLFHGSKSGIAGKLSLDHSREGNDFGRGFYCGENFEQSAMFVSKFEHSSIYMIAFCPEGLDGVRFGVDQDWMLAVALFRGRLSRYADHPRIQALRGRVEASNYVVAPIADNRMFEIIDSFIEGEITDVQCQHCLSSTSFGFQYVFTTQKALDRTRILEHCFLCQSEKESYFSAHEETTRTGLDKAKTARRQYRGQGCYIDEVLS